MLNAIFDALVMVTSQFVIADFADSNRFIKLFGRNWVIMIRTIVAEQLSARPMKEKIKIRSV